jgi:8-oxo-dGTP diphosphatase
MLAGQRLQPERYTVVPRTLSFLLHKDEILLLLLHQNAGEWAGKYNGVGGHVEKGEEPYTSALREIQEETNNVPENLSLCGVIMIDTGTVPGIALYVFAGHVLDKHTPTETNEGLPQWKKISELDHLPLVDDLPLLIPKTLSAYAESRVFSARYSFDKGGNLSVEFA